MATRFSTVYKQELKNKGVLSSMGSAVLKSARERMDVRNIFFGGKGMLSATGQKIFGRGYSSLSSGAAGAVSSAQVSAQAAATNDLISSNERQEALLRVVAKNTFNMNLMARDMNITRQNIATLTRLAAGKSAQSQDALWYDVKTRNQAIDSLGKKGGDSKPSQTAPSSSSALGGIFGGIGSMLGGIASFGGSIISGTLGAISRISPILGIIALMAGGYVIKEISKSIDFGPLKEKIYSFLGLDIQSDKNILQQWADKLDLQFDTKKFNEIYDTVSKTIIKNFGPQIDLVGKSIATASDAVLTYAKAAFMQLAAGFSGMGGAIGFLLNEFFQSNKGKILMAIAAGLAAGSAKDPRSAALALAGIGAVGLFGAATGEKSRDELRVEIDSKLNDLRLLQRRIDEAENAPNTVTGNAMRGQLPKYYEGKKAIIDKLSELGSELSGKENQLKGYLTPNFGTFNEIIEADRANWGKNYKPITPPSGAGVGANMSDTSPTQVSSSLAGVKWNDLNEQQKNALLVAQGQAEGFNIRGSLPNRLNNPGAMIYADWQKQFGGEPGEVVGPRTFTKFPTVEQGRAAQRWLWENGKPAGTPGYANMTIYDALKKWVAPSVEEAKGFQGYQKLILDAIQSRAPGEKVSQLSSELSNSQRMAMAFDGSGITVVAPTTNVQSGGGAPQSFASATNFDAIELFASNMA